MGCLTFVALANVLLRAYVSSGILRRGSIVGQWWHLCGQLAQTVVRVGRSPPDPS